MSENIENQFLKVAASTSGAELLSIQNKKDGKEYLWQGDPAFWTRRAPVLFPIVGKVTNNQYSAEGSIFKMSQHGIARDSNFVVSSLSENSITYTFNASEDTLKSYPYLFSFDIIYTIEDNLIKIAYQVKNTDDKTIWFSIGGHPGFNCPLFPGESFSDYYLEFEKNETAVRYLLDDGLFNGKSESVLDNESILNVSEKLFEKDAIVFKNLNSEKVTLKSRKSDYKLEFSFPGFPYLGIWTKGGGSPFICIEPWFGLADSTGFAGELKDKEGILSLEPQKSFRCEYSIRVGS